MKKYSLLLIGFAALPFVAYAQLGNIEGIVASIGRLVSLATPILVGIALLVFFWGLVKFIFNHGNEDAKDQGKRLMVGGVIALFVIVSIVGIIGFIGNALEIDQGGTLPVPGVGGL